MPPLSLTHYVLASTLPLSVYALSPRAPSLAPVVLVANMSLALNLVLHPSPPSPRPQKLNLLLALICSLSLGSALAFTLSNAAAFDGTLFAHTRDALVALVLYAGGTALFPLVGLLFPHLFLPLLGRTSFLSRRLFPHLPAVTASYARILFPAWRFALAGLVFERYGLGTGRVGWWIPPLLMLEDGAWVRRWAGQAGVDFVVAAAGVAAGEAALVLLGREGEERSENGGTDGVEGETAEGGVRDLLADDDGDNDHDQEDEAASGSEEEPLLPAFAAPSPSPPPSGVSALRRRRLHHPLAILVLFSLFALLAPLVPPSSSTHVTLAHPSPSDRSYTYPPLKVGCVVPPSRGRSSRSPQGAGLDKWLAETRVVAARGAKVVSWREGAVRLRRGARADAGGEGWEGMGEEERELLRRVGEICDSEKAYILATYLVPPPGTSHSSHKLLNTATLVGPRSLSPPSFPSNPTDAPYIVWSTTKQHPVPFVESYSHPSGGRADRALASAPGAVPLAAVDLPLEKTAPGRKTTPRQSVGVAGAICQDAAFPSLVGSFFTPRSSSPTNDKRPIPHTPHLLLNPSYTPLHSLSVAQLEQIRARAVEHNTFVLRCDDPASGSSALVAPDGGVRVLVEGVEGGGSWEAEVRIERAQEGTAFERLWLSSSWLGAEGAALLWLAVAIAVLAVGESGVVQRAARGVEWRERGRRAVEWARGWVRAEGRVRERVGEEGEQRAGRAEEEGRLVEVD
ncbi:hypothetical protein JCM6882_000694 [Rhodosporidiobolus microsporus]